MVASNWGLINLGHCSPRSMNAFSRESSSCPSTLLPTIYGTDREEGRREEGGGRREEGGGRREEEKMLQPSKLTQFFFHTTASNHN